MSRYHHDLYRDTWVRYLGYAYNATAIMRHMLPLPVNSMRIAHTVTLGYMIADTFDKSWNKFNQPKSHLGKVVVAAGDAIIWQSLASVIIPSFLLSRIVYYTGRALVNSKSRSFTPSTINLITVGVGLISIPIIVRPIDTAVDIFMDTTYRQIFGY